MIRTSDSPSDERFYVGDKVLIAAFLGAQYEGEVVAERNAGRAIRIKFTARSGRVVHAWREWTVIGAVTYGYPGVRRLEC